MSPVEDRNRFDMRGIREQIDRAYFDQRVVRIDEHARIAGKRRDVARDIHKARRLHSNNRSRRVRRHARPRRVDDERPFGGGSAAAQEVFDARSLDVRAIDVRARVFLEVVRR